MEHSHASQAFSILGHPDRLAVFRLAMRFAPQAVRPTEMAAALGFKPNTLSHHLADLVAVGLLRVKREGRFLHYSANLDTAEALTRYLALEIGRGRPEFQSPVASQRKGPIMRGTDFDVLFICSGNSARSIFAEALLRDLGRGRFRAFSAGTLPQSEVNPMAIAVLERNGHDVADLHAKHVSRFQAPDSPVMDFVFTVCDTAAAEECPPWPGQPVTGHWGLPDPAKASGTEAERSLVFAQTYAALRRRISAFVALPFESLNRVSLQTRVDAIGLDHEESL